MSDGNDDFLLLNGKFLDCRDDGFQVEDTTFYDACEYADYMNSFGPDLYSCMGTEEYV